MALNRQHQGPPSPHHHQHQQRPPYYDQAANPTSRPRPDMSLGPLGPPFPPMKPEVLPISRTELGRKYELIVVQQPRRARMCGFGDKDRRPITPPPCVKLVITDARTGKEIDCNDIDFSLFVLTVDLWSYDGKGEVNLVRHTTVSPSISLSNALSYAETRPIYAPIQPQQQQQFKNESNQVPAYSQQPYNPYPRDGPPPVIAYVQHPGQEYNVSYGHGYGPNDIMHPSHTQRITLTPQEQQQRYSAGAITGAQIHAQGVQGRPDAYPPQSGYRGHQGQQGNQGNQGQQGQQGQSEQGDQHPQNPRQPQQPQGMFTRNLIGSLAASAFRLTDTDDRIGIWFVLQDLSVRTEGTFRLRFSFVNVGASTAIPLPTPGASPPGNGSYAANINTGRAPILAQCFSEVFTVYSAKKFPGVVESTPLSKCFATQGIKIPIRKDGPGGDKPGKKGADFDDDD
ncbi:Velvet complex subunit B [Hyphodiscus hymeniophilus]|uniref:Velvet complex subunit B n=1 Tax=Hyphodiscus hymeniophilus TaxID=353542 RepID=A0A9P6VNX9_9HELO|nr:Velvet complex subunit B [Hyphodiscus hymeniophilus]